MAQQSSERSVRSKDRDSSPSASQSNGLLDLNQYNNYQYGKESNKFEHQIQVVNHSSSKKGSSSKNTNNVKRTKTKKQRESDLPNIKNKNKEKSNKDDEDNEDNEDNEIDSEFIHPNRFDLLATEKPKVLQVKKPTKPEISGIRAPRYLYTLYGEGIALSSLTQKDFEALELKFNSNRGCEFERMEFGHNVYRTAHFTSIQLAISALKSIGGQLICYHCEKAHLSTECVEGPITKLPNEALKNVLSIAYYPLCIEGKSSNPLLVCKTWRQFIPTVVTKIHLSVKPPRKLWDSFPYLKELTVDVNVVNANVGTFQSLFSTLTYLEIKSTKSYDAELCRPALFFTSLQCLVLERLNAFDSNEFSLQHLTTLQKLTRLELLHLKPPACQRLVELTSLTGQLEMLSLQGCDVQSDGQDLHFLTALTKLRVLDISGTKTLRTTIEPFLKNITVIDEIKDFSHENEKENNKSDSESVDRVERTQKDTHSDSEIDTEDITAIYFERTKTNQHFNKLRDAKNLHYGNRQQRKLKDPKYSAKKGRRDKSRKNKK